jgi:hypothetical protein
MAIGVHGYFNKWNKYTQQYSPQQVKPVPLMEALIVQSYTVVGIQQA